MDQEVGVTSNSRTMTNETGAKVHQVAEQDPNPLVPSRSFLVPTLTWKEVLQQGMGTELRMSLQYMRI